MSRGFLVLATAPEYALDALARRFPVQILDCDRILLAAMQSRAAARRVDWNRIIAADDPTDELNWNQLKRLVAEAIPDFESHVRAAGAHVLLTNPGLLARYGQLAVIDRLRDDPGHGVWVLVPGKDTSKPMIDGHPVPIYSESQWARLDRA